MPWNWSDTIDEDTDWHDRSFLTKFFVALAERLFFVTGGPPPGAPFFADISSYAYSLPAGVDVQSHLLWQYVQSALPSICSQYVKGDPDIVGHATDQTVMYTSSATPGPLQANLFQDLLGQANFTRKFPREYHPAGVGYVGDNAPYVDGDYALNIIDGKVYHRVSGAWALSIGSNPTVKTDYGLMQAGDFFGPWIFNEIRSIINAFRTTLTGVTGTGGDRKEGNADISSAVLDYNALPDPTYATAYSLAASTRPASTGAAQAALDRTGDSNILISEYAVFFEHRFVQEPGVRILQAHSSAHIISAQTDLQSFAPTALITRTTTVYMRGNALGTNSARTTYIFDNTVDGRFSEGVFGEIVTATTASTAFVIGTIGNSSAYPPAPTPPESHSFHGNILSPAYPNDVSTVWRGFTYMERTYSRWDFFYR